MRIPLLILALIFFQTLSFGQSNEIDSLLNLTKSAIDSPGLAYAHGRLAWLLMYNDLDAAFKHNDSSMQIYQELSDAKNIAIAQYKYGVLYRVRGNYKEALKAMNRYRDYSAFEKDTFGLANGYFQLGVIHSKKGDYEQALESYYDALDIYEHLPDSTGMGFTMNGIGIVYKNLKKYPDAINIYEKTIAIHEKRQDFNRLADAHHNLGSVYHEQMKFKKALSHYFIANELNEGNNNQWGLAINYTDIGSVYMEQQAYGKAIEYLNLAYTIQLKNNYTDNRGLTLANLGEAYFRTGEYDRAERYLKEGIALADVSKKIRRELHHNLFELYQQQGAYKKALKNHKLYVVLNDSIIDEKSVESINTLQVRYETAKKDEKLARQQLQLKETENTLLKTENQNKLAIAGGLLLLLVSIGSWIYFRQRQRLKTQQITRLKTQQEVLKLEALIQGEEKERIRLAQDLHDGINGDLAVIKYKISSLDPQKFEKKQRSAFQEAIGMLDNAVEQIRRISHNLAPPALHNFELVEAIRQYCVKVGSANPSLQINFQYFGENLLLEKETETALYRMVQELMTNVVKHAEASEALVQINHRDEILHITVEDNGRGFDINSESTGIGMQNIRSRAHYLGGELDIDSSPNGTTVQINIDLKKISGK